MIRWPAQAAKAIQRLFRPVQDIDVYVEDSGSEVFYAELFRRAVPEVRIERVVALHGKRNVIEAAREYASARPALFLIDGDMDWIRGESPPSIPRLVRLNCYCIENVLICEDGTTTIVGEELELAGEAARRSVEWERWEAATRHLVPLFVRFALLNKHIPEEATVGAGVGVVLSQTAKSKPAAISAHKLAAAIARCEALLVRALGKANMEMEVAALTARVASLAEPVAVVSGKDFLLPLLELHLSAAAGLRLRNKSFRFRLAKACDAGRLTALRDAVLRALAV